MPTGMPTRRFGRTELAMPVFTCGGMRYQHAWRDAEFSTIPEDNQRNLEATIHKALDSGINHIETARGYGTSEVQLGQILPTLPRESLIVQTKVALDTLEGSPEAYIESIVGTIGLDPSLYS